MSAPRVAPGGLRELLPARWAFGRAAARVTRTETQNLFTTLGRHRKLFWRWLAFASALMPGGRLPRRESELVILRVAHLRECEYEFSHHVHLSRRAGVGPADVERMMAGPAAEGWSARERAILAAVEELHERGDLSDEAFGALAEHLGDRSVIELVMLVGHYEMLATAITALRIQTDRPLESAR